ncbi:hypothetical protein QTN25_000110 [Entamoeba marina]
MNVIEKQIGDEAKNCLENYFKTYLNVESALFYVSDQKIVVSEIEKNGQIIIIPTTINPNDSLLNISCSPCIEDQRNYYSVADGLYLQFPNIEDIGMNEGNYYEGYVMNEEIPQENYEEKDL